MNSIHGSQRVTVAPCLGFRSDGVDSYLTVIGASFLTPIVTTASMTGPQFGPQSSPRYQVLLRWSTFYRNRSLPIPYKTFQQDGSHCGLWSALACSGLTNLWRDRRAGLSLNTHLVRALMAHSSFRTDPGPNRAKSQPLAAAFSRSC